MSKNLFCVIIMKIYLKISKKIVIFFSSQINLMIFQNPYKFCPFFLRFWNKFFFLKLITKNVKKIEKIHIDSCVSPCSFVCGCACLPVLQTMPPALDPEYFLIVSLLFIRDSVLLKLVLFNFLVFHALFILYDIFLYSYIVSFLV